MSSRSRGQLTERMIQEKLEADGWVVTRAPPSYRFNKQTDLFGLWDFVCFKVPKTIVLPFVPKPEHMEEIRKNWPMILMVKVVQGKTNNKPNKEWISKAIAWKDQFNGASAEGGNLSCEIWTYYTNRNKGKKRGFEIINI